MTQIKKLKSYAILREEFGNNPLTYEKLLTCLEWHNKREAIIHRDNHECTNCKNRTTEYVLGNHIWWLEYFIHVKKLNEKFWERWDYYEKLLGEKFIGIASDVNDYEYVNEKMGCPNIVGKQYCLQVHHKYYIKEKLPWEYNDDALITLCNWCHFKLHQDQIIPIYSNVENVLIELEPIVCSRCNGAGFFPEYAHVQVGVCFQCKGNRYINFIL